MGLRFALPTINLFLHNKFAKRCNRIIPEMGHDIRNLFHALGTQQPDLSQVIVAIAVSAIDLIEIVD